MNRTQIWLTLSGITAIFALATACNSGGGDDDDDGASGKGNTSTGGNTGTAGSGNTSTGGQAIPTAGTTGTGTAGTTGTGTAGTTGTGTAGAGTGGTTGTGGPSVCDGKTFALPVGEAYIDNFETDTRFTGWYAFSDTTVPNMPAPDRANTGALTTMYSGHVGASGIKSSKMGGYGAGFGFGLVDPLKGNCVDLSAFAGISFWIKGTAGADNTLTFQVVSPSTQPSDSMPAGDCVPKTACAFAHPKKSVKLTADWTQIVIKFADLAPAAAYSGKVMGFNMITDGPAYDVNIDEVTFFTDMAPTGPIMPDLGTGGAGAGGSSAGGSGGSK